MFYFSVFEVNDCEYVKAQRKGTQLCVQERERETKNI